MEGNTNFDSKYGLGIGIGILLIAGIAILVTSQSSSLPESATMSDSFKKQAFPAVVSTFCALNDAKPKNTADQRVVDLFEQCFEYDRKMGELSSHAYMTDSMKDEFNSLEDKRNSVKGELEEIFKQEGMDADAERAKQMKDLLR